MDSDLLIILGLMVVPSMVFCSVLGCWINHSVNKKYEVLRVKIIQALAPEHSLKYSKDQENK
jgi:hypothetical protein